MEQYRYEVDAWFRLLEFIKQENVYLKNKLALAMDAKIDKNFLILAERFQSEFMNNDILIKFFKGDIMLHRSLLGQGTNKDATLTDEIIKKHNIFREDVAKLEKEFSRLKFEFNNCVQNANIS